MGELAIGAGLALLSAASGAFVAYWLGRASRAKQERLATLAIFAGKRLEAYTAFRDAYLNFHRNRSDPQCRKLNVERCGKALTAMYLVGVGHATNVAADMMAVIQREHDALQEYVFRGVDNEDEERGKPAYRIRFGWSEDHYRREFARLDEAFVQEARREFGLKGILERHPGVVEPRPPGLQGEA